MSCIELVAKVEGSIAHHSHWHYSDQLFFVRSGCVEVQINNHYFIIDEPSIIFISHLDSHTFISNSEAYSRYYVNIKPNESHSQIKDGSRLLSPFINRSKGHHYVIPVSEFASTLDTLFSLLYNEYTSSDCQSAQYAILQIILQVIYRHMPDVFPYDSLPLNSTVQAIQQRFEKNPADETSLADLATEHHFSVSYLTHCFKEATGYSIGKFRMLCRIAAAKQMLVTTKLPISTISNQCGFADLSNFCRYFRKEVGCSPSSFRENNGHEH